MQKQLADLKALYASEDVQKVVKVIKTGAKAA